MIFLKNSAYKVLLFSCFLSLFIFFPESSSAQSEHAKQTMFLSGTDNQNTVSWDFFCTGGRKSGYWTSIEVPSCWEQQGFGTYDYGRDYRTYGKKFRFADEKGRYRHEFEVPSEWEDRDVHIVFEGSMTDTEVKVNGQLAGPVHQGSFYRFRYDITDKLLFGQINKLEVEVSKMSAEPSVNRAERYADYWIFGGIFRPVFLEAYPKEHLDQVAVVADQEGNFEAHVSLKNVGNGRLLHLEILDQAGQVIATKEKTINGQEQPITITSQVQNPLLWSSEFPHLYAARLSLKDNKQVLYQTTETFGFRTVEIREGDGIYVNGQKIKFKGINRHCFWPETGRTLSREIDRKDVELMKAMNMNAVRCAHYPPDKSFLELCDSLGLYVIDELAGWQNAYGTEVGEKLVREMVLRDVNHPSVILWSNGNEGGTNKELDDDFLLYDPSQRPVIHAHHRPGNDFNGVETNHYEKYYSTKDILDGPLIYMPTEFLHAQDDGGAAAGLEDFWELMWNSPRSAGGFLWALIDEGIVRTDLNGFIDVNRVNAPDGVLGPHREKEGSFFALKEIWSPIVIREEQLPENFQGALEVSNRYHFTNLDQCIFQVNWVDFHKAGQAGSGHVIREHFELKGPNLGPGEQGTLSIPVPENWAKYGGLHLSALAPDGEEVMSWSWPVKAAAERTSNLLRRSEDELEVTFLETDSTLSLNNANTKIILNKTSGLLEKIESELGLNPSLSNGPVLVSGDSKLKSFRHFAEEDGQVIELIYDGDLKFVKWKMYPNGWVSLDYEYQVEGKQPFLGVSFDYPEANIIGVKWLGNGPYRVWKNRPQGGTFDVWEAMYNDTHTGSTPWAYPEFKGYYSDIAWMEFNTVEGKILMATPDKDLFVRLFDFYGLSGAVPHPELPGGNISFLDGIPPIGTKLAIGIDPKTEGLGPMSELNEMNEPIRRRLYFYFGLLD